MTIKFIKDVAFKDQNEDSVKIKKGKILTARVDALIRRSYSIDSSEVTDVGGIIIEKAAHIVKIDGQEID